MHKRFFQLSFFLCLLLLSFGCKSRLADYGPLYQPEVSNPQHLEVSLKLELKDIHLLKGEELRKECREREIPQEAVPQLSVWSAQIIERPSQRDVELLSYSATPDNIFLDPQNGNLIGYWDLTPALQEGGSLVLERQVQFMAYEVFYRIEPAKVGEYRQGKLFTFYTRAEPFLEQSEEIKRLARRIVGNERNPYHKARRIYGWLVENLKYYYPPEKRSAAWALEKRGGDCGQYAYLFIALCRAVGVPSRFVGGFTVAPGKAGFHAWAEFYLPNYAWVPADPSVGGHYREEGKDPYELFARLPNNRLIASVGTSIPLEPVPEWTTYENSELEQGCTDFMQMATVLSAGVEYKRSSSLEVSAVTE